MLQHCLFVLGKVGQLAHNAKDRLYATTLADLLPLLMCRSHQKLRAQVTCVWALL